MSRQRVQNLMLYLIAIAMAPVGFQAALTPRAFYDDFPLDRGWIAKEGGAYNEHLVRDVGVLFIALVIVTVWTAWRSKPARPVAVAWFVQGVLHFWYHVDHLDDYGTFDKLAMLGSLVAIPALAAIALWAGRSRTSA